PVKTGGPPAAGRSGGAAPALLPPIACARASRSAVGTATPAAEGTAPVADAVGPVDPPPDSPSLVCVAMVGPLPSVSIFTVIVMSMACLLVEHRVAALERHRLVGEVFHRDPVRAVRGARPLDRDVPVHLWSAGSR